MDPYLLINRLCALFKQGRKRLSQLISWLSPLFDEGLRHVLWWALLMVFTVGVLELCRWFWLIYPETVIGKKYVLGAELPPFADTVLHEPHWYPALFLVSVPCLSLLAVACFSRFFYLKRLFYDPFGSILRMFIWATPITIFTGYVVTASIDFGLEAAITLAAVPSLAFVPQAFRTANRLFPEILDCIRWLIRRLKQLRRRPKSRATSEPYPGDRAHLF